MTAGHVPPSGGLRAAEAEEEEVESIARSRLEIYREVDREAASAGSESDGR